MKKIQILVAQHKETEVFKNEVYTPIHVGKSLSKLDLGILDDATGDNISRLNPYFCELTAQYWAWKNIHDVEYIGLCHYRRYFEKEFTAENIDEEMKDCDVILAKRLYMPNSPLQGISIYHTPEDAYVFYDYMMARYPEQKLQFESFFLKKNWGNAYNMFVCKKDVFDDFCKWQFSILMDLFKIVPMSPYTREKRLMGYYAENMFPYYVMLNHLKVKEIPIVSMIGEKKKSGAKKIVVDFVKRSLNTIWFKLHMNNFKIPQTDPIRVGLKADKIEDIIKNTLYGKE